MEQQKVSTSRLFVTSIIESKRDEIEEKLEQGYQTLHGLVSGLSEKEAHDALNSAVSRDKAHEEAVTLGLLCVILSEPQHAIKSFRDLTLVTRDGLQLVMMNLSQLAVEKWLRMVDVARSQLLWLLRELIRTGAVGVDNVCYNLMRHAAGGDVSPRNIALVDYMLDTFVENRTWLEKHPVLLSSMVYNYLRLIEDHAAPQFVALRQKEISFVVTLLRERFADCMVIGRDLVRLLQNVARIPEIELLWRDVLNNPKSLCPSFTGAHVAPLPAGPAHARDGAQGGVPHVARTVRPAQAIPGLVPEAVPGDARVPDPAHRPDPLHRRRDPSHQRVAVL
uniref:SOSS complex subunit A homolog n=1 Tax=Graphocephala atropunctata TaxID=36148 RepID=A0A1B6L0J6_9HEMI